MLFAGSDSTGDVGLWITNGTAAGTHELTVAGALTTPQGFLPGGLNPSDLTAYNGYVFFAGDDGAAKSNYGGETDGTASGTPSWPASKELQRQRKESARRDRCLPI